VGSPVTPGRPGLRVHSRIVREGRIRRPRRQVQLLHQPNVAVAMPVVPRYNEDRPLGHESDNGAFFREDLNLYPPFDDLQQLLISRMPFPR